MRMRNEGEAESYGRPIFAEKTVFEDEKSSEGKYLDFCDSDSDLSDEKSDDFNSWS